MKRIEALREYPECGYPATAAPARGDRRDFLRHLAAAAAAGGGLLLGEAAEASPRPLGGAPALSYHVEIAFSPPYRFAHCSTALSGVVARTWDYRVGFFLRDQKERREILKTLYGVLGRHRCPDVQDDVRRAQLQRALGKAVSDLYQRRTKRQGYAGVTLRIRPAKTTCDERLGPGLPEAPAGY